MTKSWGKREIRLPFPDRTKTPVYWMRTAKEMRRAGNVKPGLQRRLVACWIAVVVALAFPRELSAQTAGAVPEQQQGQASGLPLPRFVSLKSDRVNLRSGPGTDYPTSW